MVTFDPVLNRAPGPIRRHAGRHPLVPALLSRARPALLETGVLSVLHALPAITHGTIGRRALSQHPEREMGGARRLQRADAFQVDHLATTPRAAYRGMRREG
jgi:hypothetical protein